MYWVFVCHKHYTGGHFIDYYNILQNAACSMAESKVEELIILLL